MMMRQKMIAAALTLGLAMAFSVPANAGKRQFKNTVGGAAIGAGVGALVGGSSGAKTGAVVGAIAGAVK